MGAAMEAQTRDTAAALEVLSQRLTRQLEASMHACAHCGLCNDSCHYYVSLAEPEMVPTYKADRLRNVWKRRYDWLGQVWPWYVGARELDEGVIQELWDTAWGACTMCGRCVFNCPFGVDTRLIIGTARAMLGAMGLVPQGLQDTVDIHLQTKNNMGVSDEDFRDTIEWLDEQVCDELEVEGPVIPLDKQGARVHVPGQSARGQVLSPVTYGRRQGDVRGGRRLDHEHRLLGRDQLCPLFL